MTLFWIVFSLKKRKKVGMPLASYNKPIEVGERWHSPLQAKQGPRDSSNKVDCFFSFFIPTMLP